MMGAEGAPPHWIVYFAVSDVDAALSAAQANGGSVLAPAVDTPFGRMAGLADPAGVAFFAMETDPSQQPDRSEVTPRRAGPVAAPEIPIARSG